MSIFYRIFSFFSFCFTRLLCTFSLLPLHHLAQYFLLFLVHLKFTLLVFFMTSFEAYSGYYKKICSVKHGIKSNKGCKYTFVINLLSFQQLKENSSNMQFFWFQNFPSLVIYWVFVHYKTKASSKLTTHQSL